MDMRQPIERVFDHSRQLIHPRGGVVRFIALGVENELNSRPRIVLNDRTPSELFWALLASENRPRCDVD